METEEQTTDQEMKQRVGRDKNFPEEPLDVLASLLLRTLLLEHTVAEVGDQVTCACLQFKFPMSLAWNQVKLPLHFSQVSNCHTGAW